MKLRAALTLLVVLAACDQGQGKTEIRAAGTTTQEIQGGTFDSTSSNVVAILIGAGQGGICSGSLIAPNLVLTAHHCVADSLTTACGSNGFGTTFAANTFRVTMSATAAEAVFNGTAQWPQPDNVTWFSANLISVPTAPANNICGGDMALIRLTTNITSVCPLIPRVDSPVALNEAYTAVGFGITSPTGQSAGRRYTVSGLNVLCEGSCGQGTDATREWVGGTSAQRGVCEGDSGGPALDAQRRVLGTVSRGDANSCNEALYESVYGQAAWIKSVAVAAATAGGYTAPDWATGGSTSFNACTGVDGGTGGGAGGGAGGGTGGGAGGGAGGGVGGGFGGGGGSTGTCNAGTMCVDASGQGDFACLTSTGNIPSGAPACSQTVACPGGYSCWQTGTSTFACLQDCAGTPTGGGAGGGTATGGGAGGGSGGGVGGGGGSSGGACTNSATTCVDASGMGNYACVDTSSMTGVPAGAQSCGTGSPCPSNYSCWGTGNGNFCLQDCTPGATGGGAGGGGGPVGGGAGGGIPTGGGTGGGPVGGGAGGGIPVGGGTATGGGTAAGGGTGGASGGGTGTGGGTSSGGGTGTGGSGGAAGGGSGGQGGGFMFPGLPEQPKKTGCSCASLPPETGWIALMGLTLLRRRRKN